MKDVLEFTVKMRQSWDERTLAQTNTPFDEFPIKSRNLTLLSDVCVVEQTYEKRPLLERSCFQTILLHHCTAQSSRQKCTREFTSKIC